MNQIRELTKDDWRLIEKALDNFLRCQLGQFGVLFAEFWLEFSSRLDDKVQVFGKELTEKGKGILRENLKRVLEIARDDISITAFGKTFGSKHASFGVRSLDDPTRLLGIQATLRRCNFSDDLSKCPDYPKNCCAPLTAFCPKKK